MATVDKRNLVGDLLDVLRVMRRKQHAAAFVAHHVGELSKDLVPRYRIEPCCRLVQHEQLWLARQHKQQRCLDALTVREAFDLLLRPESEALQQQLSIGGDPRSGKWIE